MLTARILCLGFVLAQQPNQPPKLVTPEAKPKVLAGGIPFSSKVYVQEYFKGDGTIHYVVFNGRGSEVSFEIAAWVRNERGRQLVESRIPPHDAVDIELDQKNLTDGILVFLANKEELGLMHSPLPYSKRFKSEQKDSKYYSITGLNGMGGVNQSVVVSQDKAIYRRGEKFELNAKIVGSGTFTISKQENKEEGIPYSLKFNKAFAEGAEGIKVLENSFETQIDLPTTFTDARREVFLHFELPKNDSLGVFQTSIQFTKRVDPNFRPGPINIVRGVFISDRKQ